MNVQSSKTISHVPPIQDEIKKRISPTQILLVAIAILAIATIAYSIWDWMRVKALIKQKTDSLKTTDSREIIATKKVAEKILGVGSEISIDQTKYEIKEGQFKIEDGKLSGEGKVVLTTFGDTEHKTEYSGKVGKGEILEGTLILPNGDVYKGKKFINNKLYDPDGTYRFRNKIVFKGPFVNGVIREGTAIFPDGTFYVGTFHSQTFEEGLIYGTGEMTTSQGEKFKGSFIKNRLSGSNCTWITIQKNYIHGAFENGEVQGRAIIALSNGGKQEIIQETFYGNVAIGVAKILPNGEVVKQNRDYALQSL